MPDTPRPHTPEMSEHPELASDPEKAATKGREKVPEKHPGTAWAWLAIPTLLLLLAVLFPVLRGAETFYLRDVMATHFPMKLAQAEAMREGRFPLVDIYRASGQPLAGNPNAVPFYPTNLLYLTSGALWAMNAHFWLHLLLALPAFAWMGREWGLSRRGTWAGGALWVTSGYVLSQMNFLNLVAGVALVPALVAAGLRLARVAGIPGAPRGRSLAVLGLLWGLLLLAGDPTLAALGLAAAVAALLSRGLGLTAAPAADQSEAAEDPVAQDGSARRRRLWSSRPLLVATALALGTLVALPQLVELLRILPSSFRGVYGYSFQAATAASWDPRQALDLLLPMPFGRLDLNGPGAFWGHHFHGGSPPFYLSLFPGALVLALAAAAPRPRWRLPHPHSPHLRGELLSGPVSLPGRAALWGWLMVAGGLFFALGRFNPLAVWIYRLPGLRYPVKLWLWVALGITLLAALGFERLFERPATSRPTPAGPGEARPTALRRALIALGGLALVLLAAWAALRFGGGDWLRRAIDAGPRELGEGFAAAEQARLAGTAFVAFSAALCLLLWLALARFLGRGEQRHGALLSAGSPLWGAGLIALHSAFQLLLLAPLLSTDDSRLYATPPPLLEQIPDLEVLAHGGFGGLFGPSSLARGTFPDDRGLWLTRRAFYELYPVTGPLWGKRYAFNTSPEGLDSFLTRVTQAAVKDSSDRERLALLAASGVEAVLLDRPLDEETRAATTRIAGKVSSFGGTLYAYEIREPAEPVQLVGEVLWAPDLTGAFRQLTAPGFDPRRQAVLIGKGEPRNGLRGEVEVEESEPEHLVATVRSESGGLLTTYRAWLPLYRATVGGREVETVPVNMHLLGVPVPAGEHRVEITTYRAPLLWTISIAGISLLSLLGLSWKNN